MPGIAFLKGAFRDKLINIGKQRDKVTQPGSVAVNHARLWISRQQFESAPGYSFYIWFNDQPCSVHSTAA